MLPLLWLADYGVRQLSTHSILSRLQHDGESLAAALVQTNGEWQLDPSRLGTLYQRVYSGHYYLIKNVQGTNLRSRSLWDREPAHVPLLAPGLSQHGTQSITVNEQTINDNEQSNSSNSSNRNELWLSYTQGVRIDQTDFTIWVAEDISPLRQQLQRYRYMAIALLAVALVALLLLQRHVLQRAFARLNPLEKQLRELRFGEREHLSTSSSADSVPLEVQPLVAEIDRLLHLLQERSARSRNALGNLAHEMKRPLQQLQLMSEQLNDEQQASLHNLLNQLQHLVNRELKRARIVGMASPGRHLNVEEDLPALIDVLQKLYPAVHTQTQWPDAAILPFDRDDLLELIGNLLDNACKYGGRGVGQSNIKFKISQTTEQLGWEMCICDQGSCILSAEQQRILNRGTRLDESVQNEGQEGSGLGLAMVSDIVASYRGELTLSHNQPQGLCVRVWLPIQELSKK